MMIYNNTKQDLSFISNKITNINDVNNVNSDVDVIVTYFDEENIKKLRQLRKLYTNAYILILTETYSKEEHYFVLKNKLKYYIQSNSKDDIINIFKNLRLLEVSENMKIDYQNKTITIGENIIKLTPKEIDIFKYLNEHKNKTCSRKDILVDVLEYHPDGDTRIIDVYIKYLRNKLGDEGKKIKTIRGVGYVYEQ